MANDENKRNAGFSPDRPPPSIDPTTLTTQALTREIAALKELTEQRIEGLENLCREKFKAMHQTFKMVERQRIEQKQDTQMAVNAALKAQQDAVHEQTEASEKAINKSESSTNDSLKQLAGNFSTEITSLRREINEVKDRVTSIESQKIGAKEDRTGLYAAIGIVGTLLAIIVLVSNIIFK
jgi:DNA repair exonuclease SbcCD ATPase subunit